MYNQIGPVKQNPHVAHARKQEIQSPPAHKTTKWSTKEYW
jgi:hypothetical protein